MCFVLLYTQQRKGLPGNVGKVHNQSSSHSFTPCTQALAVVANVLVILIYTEWSFFTSFASNFAMCSLECLIINAQIGYVNNLCAHTFFFFRKAILHWNASWILLMQCMCSFKPDSRESKCLQNFFNKMFCSSLFWHNHYTL